VAILYSVTKGYLDAVPIEKVRAWEEGFHDLLDRHHAPLLKMIAERKALDAEIEKGLQAAIAAWSAEQTS